VDENTRVLSSEAGGRALCELVLDPGRVVPVLALTCRPGESEPALKVGEVRERIGLDIPIYVLRGRKVERVLAAGLPEHFEVRDGAARVWWPGVNPTDTDFFEHPLVLNRRGEYGERELARIEEELFPPLEDLDSDLPLEERARFVEHRRVIEERRRVRAEQRARVLESELVRLRRRLQRYEPDRAADEEEEGTVGEGLLVLGEEIPPADEPPAGAEGELWERLDGLIVQQYRRALSEAERDEWPLRRYVYGPGFLESVKRRSIPTPLGRIARVCAMIACGRAPGVPGLGVHALRDGTGGQLVRGDGGKGWRVKLQDRSGGPRLHYWTLPDGTVVFDAVGDHDLTP
jgi:hypothetical protein